MGKLPAFQFYPSDWRSDPGVQALDYHDRGVWFEILCLMHESEDRGKLLLNGQAMPDDALARVLGLDKQNLSSSLTTLLTYGVASRDEETGALICRRMVRDEEIRQIRSNAGKQGGNPVLLKQNPTKHPSKTEANGKQAVKQNPTPSSSSSSSSSIIERDGADAPPTPNTASGTAQSKTKATSFPDPFPISDAMAAWAAENVPGVPLKLETEKMVDYYRNQDGKKAVKKDWVAAWRNWMRNAVKFSNYEITPQPDIPQWKKDRDACPLCDADGLVWDGGLSSVCGHGGKA